ncbi:MAG TPA: long-chain fatty acid--CoA ligase [Marinobacter hydrocarbonoclasticus]|jgi:fatty-acyl-CoA synthase|uniref:fatty acid--CoA ligase n=1 Tax=Marinobacter TaxID=2742 RepID=UPI000C3D6460|nr:MULTISPECIES: fatty acid--CoA ligase [Marinobacter]MAL33746.1 long-chain fatty acid--CoA ligase [Marinobacter sp.]RKR77746.1 fatty-acyl-CoA synthase [Marinobacter nauticus]HAX08894.1 long-chain fatty acid--CoA ligase [Marinobacter nauticus]HCR46674.1 long-chain fatty acid--CoA ligase [Marinobacter nauticus]|tara:strand:+ start:4613 stop:6259 length:1647 start_codon:yes stop_codon:yes gene_type:complete
MAQPRILKPADNAHQYQLLIKRLLMSGPRYNPDQEIVYADRSKYTYKDLVERIHRLANALTDAGIKPGDTVAVMDWDTPRYLECFFAIPMIGAILHTVNVRLSPEQIVYTMNHAEDDAVLVHDDFLPIIEGVKDEIKTVKTWIQVTDSDKPGNASFDTHGEYEALLAGASDHFDFPDFDENSVATTFYTTGTTGNPKGVYFSHRQLVLHTLSMAGSISHFDEMPLLRSSSVYMPVTPMFHVHAWGVPYAATMMGIKQVYPGRYEPELLVDLLKEHKVSFSHCVPTIMQMMMATESIKTADLSNWHVLIGGSALTKGLCDAGAKLGIKMFTGYGMSETCPLLSTTHLSPADLELPLEQQTAIRVKTGKAVPMVELEIVDPDGNPVAHDGEAKGEVVARAPWLTQSYFKQPDKGEELWEGGWLHTGDVASMEPDNTLTIKDRIKDVIKTGGEWLSSLDLENMISQHPAVAGAAVVGVPDEKWGERPYALITLKPGESISEQDIKQHLQQFVDSGDINKWAIPEQMRFVEDIPKTSVGKINKKLIRDQLKD